MNGSMLSRVARLVCPHGSIRTVWRGPAAGLRFRVRPSMGLTYVLGFDAYHTSWLHSVVRPGMTVFDIGANIGQTTLPFSQWTGPTGKVVAFEPVPANVSQLRDNIALNNASNVSIVEAALSDRSGVETFLLNPQQASMGKLENCEPTYNEASPRGQRFEVKTIRLDDAAAEHGMPHFLKIDVEGGAKNVFEGGRKVLESAKPAIYLELHGPEEQAAVRDILSPLGYQLRTLDGTVVPDPVHTPANPLWCVPPGN